MSWTRQTGDAGRSLARGALFFVTLENLGDPVLQGQNLLSSGSEWPCSVHRRCISGTVTLLWRKKVKCYAPFGGVSQAYSPSALGQVGDKMPHVNERPKKLIHLTWLSIKNHVK